MRRILVGAVTVVLGGAVALGVRNRVVENPAGASAGVVETDAAPAAANPGGATRSGEAARGGAAAASDAPVAAGPAPAAAPGSGPAGVDASPARGGGRRAPEDETPASAAGAGGAAGGAAGAAPRGAAGAGDIVGGADGADGGAAVQEPDAATLLLRASAAYEKVRSLRANFVQTAENPLLRNRVTSRGTLYQRRPDRFLMKFSEPAGDVIVSDGASIWIYYPSVDDAQVIRAPLGAGGAGGADLQAQFLGDPLTRFTPRLEGQETVNGRRAFVLLLTPRVDMGYRSLKVWIDAADFLVRRFELVESNGVARHFELEGLEVNPTIPDSMFRFSPPPGARIVERG
ncbi:MAG TPA: outer membrane lipoprotein carrier protein LolA [Longimicrobiales bacterium]